MKITKILLALCIFMFVINMHSQASKDTLKSNQQKEFNLLDAQIDVLKTVTGDQKVDGIDFKKINNYNDLVNQAKDLSPKEKSHYKSIYEMQKNETDQKSKDSLALVLENLILNAKKKKN